MKAEADNSNFNFSHLCDDVSFAGGRRERHSPGPNLALNGPALTLTYTRPPTFDRLQRRNNSHSGGKTNNGSKLNTVALYAV